MPFDYVSVEEAMKRGGLHMVVVGDVPSPWPMTRAPSITGGKVYRFSSGLNWTTYRAGVKTPSRRTCRNPHVRLGSCVTSIASPHGGAQLYER
jgi:hypothetical protein